MPRRYLPGMAARSGSEYATSQLGPRTFGLSRDGTVYDIDLVSQNWHDIKWDHKLQVFVPKGAPQDVVAERVERAHLALLGLLGHQMRTRDPDLLFLGIAGQLQHLHAVAQRVRNRIEHVRGRDEQDFG